MYWPTTPANGEYIFRRMDGPWLDPDAYLAAHPNWRDCSLLPTSSRESTVRSQTAAKQEDPLEKEGVVGAFCRAYPIEDAIDRFLSDVYEPSDVNGRYDYIPADSSAGVVIYDGKFAYSHHATDPACGMLLNAFDLVRLHLFGGRDDRCAPDSAPGKLPSFKAMTELALKDERVKAVFAQERMAQAAEEFDEDKWQERLELNKAGNVKNTLHNLTLVLENDPNLKPLVFNQLLDGMEIKGAVPWKHPSKFWRDADDAQLISYVDTHYQCLPWNHRGWHCGASGNNTHIGVEMCEPACIKYTGGATFTCSDLTPACAVARTTYQAAVELFAMLCQKFNLDPLGDGVIVSHKEGCKRGIASNHGDPEHLWSQLGMPYTMDTFRAAVKAAMGGGDAAPGGVSGTKIMGEAVATADQMRTYLKAKNPKVVQSVLDMVPLYLSEGAAEGVRGDIAFAQSCLETGNFSFAGSAVTLEQNNFCGMGVTANGMKGNSFATPQLGIRAQVQHLKAYASTEPLKNECIDPRFKYVARGCAEVVEWLGQKENPQGKGWAISAGYGEKIIAILNAILATAGGAAPTPTPTAVPFLVKVSTPDLRIRTGPGTNTAKTGKYTGVGVFTITEVKNGPGSTKGWGKLKSGAGWISLDFAQKI